MLNNQIEPKTNKLNHNQITEDWNKVYLKLNKVIST